MSRSDKRASGCEGKKVFTYSESRRNAKMLNRYHDEQQHHYHCTFCHGWHVGSANRWERKARKVEREMA